MKRSFEFVPWCVAEADKLNPYFHLELGFRNAPGMFLCVLVLRGKDQNHLHVWRCSLRAAVCCWRAAGLACSVMWIIGFAERGEKKRPPSLREREGGRQMQWAMVVQVATREAEKTFRQKLSQRTPELRSIRTSGCLPWALVQEGIT